MLGKGFQAAWGVVLGVLALAGSAWAETATRASAFEYDATSGLLTKEIVEPGNAMLRLETAYVPDAFGNRRSVTISAPAGASSVPPRTSTETYDSQGRFATSAANALNHSETRVFDTRFGGMTSLIGPNALTTQWQYDGLGRRTLEIRADGTRTKSDYLYCNGVNGGTTACPALAKYLVRMTPLATNGTTQNGPMETVYFDGLNREVHRSTQGFDGATIWSSKQYDALGRQTHQSRPYFDGATPLWIVQQYDVLARVTIETQADNSSTTFGYAGLLRTSTNSLNQTRTETRNSQDQVVSVLDAAGGTTTFQYDPFSNLTRTVDAAGNVTTAQYDIRGHKTRMTEPNMGTWSYTYDGLGKVLTQTDAKGITTTITYDKLDRPLVRSSGQAGVNPWRSYVQWVYDNNNKGIGKVDNVSMSVRPDANVNGPAIYYGRNYSYDQLGRLWWVSYNDATFPGNMDLRIAYDGDSRVSTSSVTFNASPASPISTLRTRNTYTNLSYLKEVREDTSNASTGARIR